MATDEGQLSSYSCSLLLRSAAGASLALTRLDDRLIGHTWILRAQLRNTAFHGRVRAVTAASGRIS
jgi:hypothetical protein